MPADDKIRLRPAPALPFLPSCLRGTPSTPVPQLVHSSPRRRPCLELLGRQGINHQYTRLFVGAWTTATTSLSGALASPRHRCRVKGMRMDARGWTGPQEVMARFDSGSRGVGAKNWAGRGSRTTQGLTAQRFKVGYRDQRARAAVGWGGQIRANRGTPVPTRPKHSQNNTHNTFSYGRRRGDSRY